MNIQKFIEPWEHYEIQNFLTEDDFIFVKKYTDIFYDLNKNEIIKNTRYLKEFKKDDILYYFLCLKFLNLIKTIDKKCFLSFNFLSNLNDDIPIGTVFNDFNLSYSVCSVGFNQHGIHQDISTKIYSGILYLNLNPNKGTELYKNYNIASLGKIIEWKYNKMFLFKRTENSWHNFNAVDVTEPRLTLNLNISKHKIIGKKNGSYLINLIGGGNDYDNL